MLKEQPEKLEEAYKIYEKLLLNSGTFIISIKPVDGIIEMLNNLKGRYKLAIATGLIPRFCTK